jgi:PST family polysaccharide transporter
MLLYNTHGWIHLAIGRPERWFRWGLFIVMLHWGPSGIALAWTASFFLLMFPGFWYAGKPIEMGIGPMFAVIWKFFAASVVAGCATFFALRAVTHPETSLGASGAFVRMISVSAAFAGIYLLAVVILHGGDKPIRDSISLLADLLPEKGRGLPSGGDVDQARSIS